MTFLLAILSRLSFKAWLRIAAGLFIAAVLGWFAWQWHLGVKARQEVERLEREVKQLENSVEALNDLTIELDAARDADQVVREVIRQVPNRALTPAEQNAVREIFR